MCILNEFIFYAKVRKLSIFSMSWMSAIFGSAPPSGVSHSITREEIRMVVSRLRIQSLSEKEEHDVEEALYTRTHGTGKLSLAQIDDTLRILRNTGVLSSDVDRTHIQKAFKHFFDKKFKK